MFNVGVDLLLIGAIFNAYLLGVIFRILLLKGNYSIFYKILYMPVELYRAINDLRANRLNKSKILFVSVLLLVSAYFIYSAGKYMDYTILSSCLAQVLMFIMCYNIIALKIYFIRRFR